jgi:dihydrofolate synthase / folylpolyglutamate synthase
VGLGGEYDATNIFPPESTLASVITNINYDHMDFLGNKIEDIAKAKLGILKLNVPLFTAEKKKKIIKIFSTKTKKMKSKLIQASYREKFIFDQEKLTIKFKYLDNENEINLNSKMIGIHQIENICLTIKVILYLKKKYKLKIENEKIKEAINKTFLPNRFEIINKMPLLIIDGAHNQAGIKILIKNVKKLFPDKNPIFIVSIMKDKQVDKMLNSLSKISNQIIFTEFEHNDRGQKIDKLKEKEKEKIIKIANYKNAFNYFFSLLNEEKIGVITGSLYFTAFAKNYLLKKKI